MYLKSVEEKVSELQEEVNMQDNKILDLQKQLKSTNKERADVLSLQQHKDSMRD